VDPIWQDVQDGIITGISVGYMVHEYEEIGEKENLSLVRANKWEATEISLAPVQADIDSGIGRSQNPEDHHETIFIRNNKNTNTMTPEEKAARAAERKRSADIVKACRAANLNAEYAQELIESERTLDEALAAIEVKKAQPVPVNETEIRAASAKEERTRIAHIRTAVRMTGIADAFGEDLIEKGTPSLRREP